MPRSQRVGAAVRRKSARLPRSTQTMTIGRSRCDQGADGGFMPVQAGTGDQNEQPERTRWQLVFAADPREPRQKFDPPGGHCRAGKWAEPIARIDRQPRSRLARHVRTIAGQLNRPRSASSKQFAKNDWQSSVLFQVVCT